ncbi:MAG: RDD family protein [Candidatus Levybacteria bacterium]|nr:RDD family protein [Candidatus Levybacteria bacterium]MDZ4228373.1 RDD family protein [Candidatus Levybacteria bacterium]
MKFASFWDRFLSYAIDIILIAIVSNIFGLKGYYFYLLQLVYFVFFWVKMDGQTLGKKVMKIRVVRQDKRKLDIQTGVIRYIGYLISGIALGLGFFWVIWDKKKQGWHDKMAKTLVIKA